MPPSPPISPRGAVIAGGLTIIMGLVPMLGALGIIPLAPTEGTPAWVGVGAGLVFVLGGVSVILGYAVAGAGADGNLPPGTPFGVRLMQYLLGMGVISLLAGIGAWIAFGAGERHFSTSSSLPFVSSEGEGSEWVGRAVFGLGAVMAAGIGVVMAVVGYRRLRK